MNVAMKLLSIKRPIDEHPEVAKLWAALTSREQIQQRSHTLLQEHMQCGVAIAKLEAQRAEYLAFMERFRFSLKQEEYDQKEEPVCVKLTFQEEPMSQDHYRDLIERIGRHCQQTTWDAQHFERKQRWLIEPGEDYDGWYLPVRNSFIALKKGTHEWEPSLAFPPATEHQFRETEQELGFSLPPLLRLCYTQIANGGFGPGYGIIGVLGGFPLMDGFGEHIAQAYQQCLHASTPIRLEEYEMITWAQWGEASDQFPDNDLEEETKLRTTRNDKADPNGERIYLYEFPSEVWPEHLLPLCYWGCGICTCIDASTEHIFQCAGGSQGYILRYVAASLEEWLERWLAGEALQFL